MTNNSLMTGISRVQIIENNIPQSPVPSSTSIGLAVIYSSKGIINEPVLITGGKNELISMFGKPKPEYGYGLYGALKFSTASSLYVVRAVGGNYAYGAAVYNENFTSGSSYINSGFAAPVFTDPKLPDSSITWNTGVTKAGAFLIRRIGCGLEGNNIAVSLTSNNMPTTPNALIATAGQDSSSLIVADTYLWKIVPVNNLGRAINSIPVNTALVLNGTTTNVAQLSWDRISAATGYEIYRKKGSGSYEFYVTLPQVALNQGTVSFVDRGQYTQSPSKVLPTDNYAPTTLFSVNIFDTTLSLNTPIESFEVSFKAGVDGFGQQQGIEEKINLLSKQIRVKRNDLFIPYISNSYNGNAIFYSTAMFQFVGGLDGLPASSIPDSAYIDAYNLLSNEEKYTLRLVIESGKTLAVQKAIIELCASRKDCIPFLDVPPDYQSASNAINYRRNILGNNTDRAALYSGDVKVYDEYNSLHLYVPPSAHAATVFANNDSSYNVWTAGAGLVYSQLTDVEDLRYKYTKDELSLLANAQVNPVHNKSGVGTYLPEQLTLASQLSALSFISVRRMIDAIELAVASAYDYSLQQPNDDFLARQLINLISSFLEPMVTGRGISKYEVVSDSSNNGPAYTNNAQRNISVYIWPTLPTRYIQVIMNITKAGVSFQELLINK